MPDPSTASLTIKMNIHSKAVKEILSHNTLSQKLDKVVKYTRQKIRANLAGALYGKLVLFYLHKKLIVVDNNDVNSY